MKIVIRVRQVKVSVLNNTKEAIKDKTAKKLKVASNDIKSFKIHKQSIDARDKKNICYTYEVDVNFKNEMAIIKRNKSQDIFITPNEEYKIPSSGKEKLNGPIVIVGSGPAGLFAAYILAESGYQPIVIERGEKITDRIKSVENFWQTGKLNINSNVQFGEGGAGTFSDGKLNTLTNDSEFRGQKVLETFVKFGADADILYMHNPHIGTDVLRNVIVNMREAIVKLGGQFLYESCLTNIILDKNKVVAIEINNKTKMTCNHLILAIGHSARDTFSWLYDLGLEMQAKPFAIGIRVEHLQKMINESQYEDFAKYLPPATYKLTYKAQNNRGVYSFCMCPGGYVVNASSANKKLAINGMSNRKRDSKNANSAIVVTVSPNDFGNHPLAGIEFQENLEAQAYKIGEGNIPIQLYKDYKNNQKSTSFGSFTTEMKGKYTFSNLNELFPHYINEALKEAFSNFDKKIKGFGADDTILSGIESRTSSPVRILRDNNYEANIKGIYPSGEGAGYAGGIITSAIDGIKVAETIIKKYSA